jgi:probable F420-dependent oxidoreductase
MQFAVAMAFNHFTPPDYVAAAGQQVEAAGFHSLWVPEHVLFFKDYASRYPYAEDGRVPGDPDGVLEPFTALTWLAANTSTLRLGTGVCILPQRHPVYTAKQVADLDYLSGGRVEFGIGVGWLREEYDALGIPFNERGKRADECLDLMRSLWCDPVSSYQGQFHQVSKALLNPKPVQQPHPPIMVGGESDAALRRAVQRGQGWYGYNLTPERLRERVAVLEGMLQDAGRSRTDFSIYAAPARDVAPDELHGFAELGVDLVVLPLMAFNQEQLQRRLPRVAALAGLAA